MNKRKCEKCNSKSLCIDDKKTGYKPPDPMPPLVIDGFITFKYEVYLKCKKCGFKFPNPLPDDEVKKCLEKPIDVITLTFNIKKSGGENKEK